MVLAFDFDGVLMQSIDEIALSAFNAATGSNCRRLTELPQPYLNRFRLNRRHARSASHIALLTEHCLNMQENQIDDVRFHNEMGQRREDLLLRGKHFFEVRGAFIEQDLPRWLALYEPYRPLWDALRARPSLHTAIVTGKNLSAVKALCLHYGLEITEERIYSGENGHSKIDHFRTLGTLHPGETLSFIDDSLENLLELKHGILDYDLVLYYATWDNPNQPLIETAKKEGISALSLDEAVRLVHAAVS